MAIRFSSREKYHPEVYTVHARNAVKDGHTVWRRFICNEGYFQHKVDLGNSQEYAPR